ncbi:MAG TPA: hypothetical protein VFN05_04755, partial [Actinomycetes bacterium]|nr:hypothetical protein [Actinomycetes bacterium]
LPGGPAGVQVRKQHMQPTQDPGAFSDQVVTAVTEQPQDHRVVLKNARAQLPVVEGGRGDRASVGQVGLAGAAGPQ